MREMRDVALNSAMEEQDVDVEQADAEGLTDAQRSAIRENGFSWNNADVVMERCAPDVALRLFAAQGACAGGTGGSAAASIYRHRS